MMPMGYTVAMLDAPHGPIRVISLQSGSNGNCIYVEAGGQKLLFDAGISGSCAEERLSLHGRDIRSVDALIISHNHADHISSAGIFQRKYGIPLYATPRCLAAAQTRCSLGKLKEVHHFRSGGTIRIGGVSIHTIPTPHDGEDGVVFVVDDGRNRLGVLTDLGHVFHDLGGTIASLDAVLLESNYDPVMLANGPYPRFLKMRIKGPGGHISNREAAELLASAAGGRLKWACLGHLSGENNSPDLALKTHREVLGDGLSLCVASRHGVSEIMCL
jgi:phosphoribosyl 1,2-cyclic phosphodiesterase